MDRSKSSVETLEEILSQERTTVGNYKVTRLIYIDIDGTLTDGKMYIDHKGEKPFKAFNARDVRAIRELIYNGWEVNLVSADDHPSGKHFAEKVGAGFIYTRDKGSLPSAQFAIGDDVFDKEMLLNAGTGFYPSDADFIIKDLSELHKLTTQGGQGVVAEFVRIISENGWM